MEFYTSKTPKARKTHKCQYCGKEIAKGEKYSYESGKFEGELFTRKLCLTCADILDTYLVDVGENEFDWWEIDDWLTEGYCDECEHGRRRDDDCECEPAQCQKIRENFVST